MITERPITRARQAVGLHAVTVEHTRRVLDLKVGDSNIPLLLRRVLHRSGRER